MCRYTPILMYVQVYRCTTTTTTAATASATAASTATVLVLALVLALEPILVLAGLLGHNFVAFWRFGGSKDVHGAQAKRACSRNVHGASAQS